MVDLTLPSGAGAIHFAREAAFTAGSPTKPNRVAGDAVLVRLLWLVEGRDGGFMGLHDKALEARAARYRLSMDAVMTAAYAPGNWPAAVEAKRVAA